jgi:glycosyltransferase involved in cell wall biosynthesis
VHDWLTGYRGGEKVLEVLCELFPDAPLYTLVHIPGSTNSTIENRPIHTSFIQKLPFSSTKYRHYLPLFPLAAETLVPPGYDLVISTSHAVAKSIQTHGAKHWCYIHTPMRYVWDRFDDYFGADLVGWIPSNLFFRPIAWALRLYDRATSGRVDHYVANSQFVAERVQKFYGREAEVINPPVDDKYFPVERSPEDFYLFFSALVPYKRADHAIKACQELGRKLIILGNGPELAKLKQLADPKWVQFIEKPTDTLVADHFSKAKALIFPTIEDFGIVPVEALSAGLPVIGLKQGGLLDSQTNDTCVFYSEQTVQSLKQAILTFENEHARFNPVVLKARARLFLKEAFTRKIRNSIQQYVEG